VAVERVYVDRIEGDRAVLVLGGEGHETATLPARLLPAGSREGAALSLSIEPAKDDRTPEQVQNLMDELFETH
jgi:hypothetical protein